jgi:hypothetical protein
MLRIQKVRKPGITEKTAHLPDSKCGLLPISTNSADPKEDERCLGSPGHLEPKGTLEAPQEVAEERKGTLLAQGGSGQEKQTMPFLS